jgi:hypothetical protein
MEGSAPLSVHDIEVVEPHPCRRGFFRRLFARVEVTRVDGYWVWRQIDEKGTPLTDAEKVFATPDAALDDAVKKLNGIKVGA